MPNDFTVSKYRSTICVLGNKFIGVLTTNHFLMFNFGNEADGFLMLF